MFSTARVSGEDLEYHDTNTVNHRWPHIPIVGSHKEITIISKQGKPEDQLPVPSHEILLGKWLSRYFMVIITSNKFTGGWF